MAEIKYHFVFSKPRQLLWYFLPLFIGMLGIPYAVLFIANPPYAWKLVTEQPLIFVVGIPGFFLALALLITLIEKKKGADIPQDEFILYDNGWFVFWCVEPDEGWIAPAKLDWVLPPAKPMKELEKEIGYRPNRWYCISSKRYYYLFKHKRNGRYKVLFKLFWTYPTDKWWNWRFYGEAFGWVNEEENKKIREFVEYIEKKARENVRSGKIKIPGKNIKQENFGSYRLGVLWNDVFKKENIRELYKKETGEDIPEPVRSFLFDYPKFKKVYLKNRRETGDWFGRKGNIEWIGD